MLEFGIESSVGITEEGVAIMESIDILSGYEKFGSSADIIENLGRIDFEPTEASICRNETETVAIDNRPIGDDAKRVTLDGGGAADGFTERLRSCRLPDIILPPIGEVGGKAAIETLGRVGRERERDIARRKTAQIVASG